jgi:hypothetical protein
MQNEQLDDARVLLARANQGDADAQAFVQQAQDKWLAKLGAKSDDNPFGIEPYEAVAYELTDTDPVFRSVHSQYTDALKLARMDPQQVYRRHAGETEARTVQKRETLTAAERQARPPWLDYDVPEADQIVRFDRPANALAMSGGRSVPDLPMDQASRMARAKEMGFDTDKTWYHVTDEDVAEFDSSRLGQNTALNSGDDKWAVDLAKMGVWQTDNPQRVSHGIFRDVDGTRVLPLYNRGNYFEKGDGISEEILSLEELGNVIDHYGGPENARKAFQDLGYDGLRVADEEFGGFSTIVFDPRDIRSVNAAFDPANADSANLLAANASPLGAAPVAAQDRKRLNSLFTK